MKKKNVNLCQNQVDRESVFQNKSVSAASPLADLGDLWVWFDGGEACLCPSAFSGCGSNWVQIKEMQFYIWTQTEVYTGY